MSDRISALVEAAPELDGEAFAMRALPLLMEANNALAALPAVQQPPPGETGERASDQEPSDAGALSTETTGQTRRLPQGAAGETPPGTAMDGLATDTSQGREATPEGEPKNEAPTRAYSSPVVSVDSDLRARVAIAPVPRSDHTTPEEGPLELAEDALAALDALAAERDRLAADLEQLRGSYDMQNGDLLLRNAQLLRRNAQLRAALADAQQALAQAQMVIPSLISFALAAPTNSASEMARAGAVARARAALAGSSDEPAESAASGAPDGEETP